MNKTPLFTLILLLGILFSVSPSAHAQKLGKPSATKITAKSVEAINHLFATNEKARALSQTAAGILIFPEIVKGGFLAGGAYGNGALFQNGEVTAFYNSAAASWGLQAGLQKYGYALFLMDKEAFDALNKKDGWNIGSAPSLVVVDEGVASSLSVTTIQKGTYAFFFDQKGLMGGLGLEGSKISRIYPEP